jgi:dienelactone hydrolase
MIRSRPFKGRLFPEIVTCGVAADALHREATAPRTPQARKRRQWALGSLTLGVLLVAAAASSARYTLVSLCAIRDVWLPQADGSSVFAKLYTPRGTWGDRLPGVVLAHGYMANLGMMESAFVRALVQRGFVVLNLDRSGHGRSSGSSLVRPHESGTRLQDFDPEMRTAISYLRSVPSVDPDRIALVGHSDGARAAIMAACADWRIAATVAISATLHPGDWINPIVPKNLLFLYGSDEAFVPGADRANLFARATDGQAIVEDKVFGEFRDGDARAFMSIKGATHVGVIYDSGALQRVVDWLTRSLQWLPSGASPVAPPFFSLGVAMAGALLMVAGVLGVLPQARSPHSDSLPRAVASVSSVAARAVLFIAAVAASTRLGMKLEPLARWLPLDGGSWFAAMPFGLGFSLLAVSPFALLSRRLDRRVAVTQGAAAGWRENAVVGFVAGAALMVAAAMGAMGWYEALPSLRKLWCVPIYFIVFFTGFAMLDVWIRTCLLYGVAHERRRRFAGLASAIGCAVVLQVSGLPPAPGIAHIPFYLMLTYLLVYASLNVSVAF